MTELEWICREEQQKIPKSRLCKACCVIEEDLRVELLPKVLELGIKLRVRILLPIHISVFPFLTSKILHFHFVIMEYSVQIGEGTFF